MSMQLSIRNIKPILKILNYLIYLNEMIHKCLLMKLFKLCNYDLSFLINFLIGLRLASLTALSEKSEEGIQSNKRQNPAALLRGGPTTSVRIAHCLPALCSNARRGPYAGLTVHFAIKRRGGDRRPVYTCICKLELRSGG